MEGEVMLIVANGRMIALLVCHLLGTKIEQVWCPIQILPY